MMSPMDSVFSRMTVSGKLPTDNIKMERINNLNCRA
jgi:hypothetical protein